MISWSEYEQQSSKGLFNWIPRAAVNWRSESNGTDISGHTASYACIMPAHNKSQFAKRSQLQHSSECALRTKWTTVTPVSFVWELFMLLLSCGDGSSITLFEHKSTSQIEADRLRSIIIKNRYLRRRLLHYELSHLSRGDRQTKKSNMQYLQSRACQ